MTTKLGSHLRRLRETRAISLKRAAPEIGVSYTYLSKLENGVQPPSDEVLQKLAVYYDEDADVLGLLAGKLPDDVLATLQGDPESAIQFLRRRFGGQAP